MGSRKSCVCPPPGCLQGGYRLHERIWDIMEPTKLDNRLSKTGAPDSFVAEQVRSLYGALPSSIAAHLVLSLLTAYVLRLNVAQGRLAMWLASVFLMAA